MSFYYTDKTFIFVPSMTLLKRILHSFDTEHVFEFNNLFSKMKVSSYDLCIFINTIKWYY